MAVRKLDQFGVSETLRAIGHLKNIQEHIQYSRLEEEEILVGLLIFKLQARVQSLRVVKVEKVKFNQGSIVS